MLCQITWHAFAKYESRFGVMTSVNGLIYSLWLAYGNFSQHLHFNFASYCLAWEVSICMLHDSPWACILVVGHEAA